MPKETTTAPASPSMMKAVRCADTGVVSAGAASGAAGSGGSASACLRRFHHMVTPLLGRVPRQASERFGMIVGLLEQRSHEQGERDGQDRPDGPDDEGPEDDREEREGEAEVDGVA